MLTLTITLTLTLTLILTLTLLLTLTDANPNAAGYQSTRHAVISSHGHVVTRSTRHRSTRHIRVSSHSQLVTSEHIGLTKTPVVIFFYLHAGQVAPRNSGQHGRRACCKRAISKSLTTAKLLNVTNAMSKRTVNSSQRRQTRRSTRHTILRCDELTV